MGETGRVLRCPSEIWVILVRPQTEVRNMSGETRAKVALVREWQRTGLSCPLG